MRRRSVRLGQEPLGRQSAKTAIVEVPPGTTRDLRELYASQERMSQSGTRLSALAERVDATCRVAAERSRYLAEPTSQNTGPDPDVI